MNKSFGMWVRQKSESPSVSNVQYLLVVTTDRITSTFIVRPVGPFSEVKRR